MSVQAQIDRISSNVTAALAKIAEKGVTVPSMANSDDLAELIAAIEAGGSGGSGKTLVSKSGTTTAASFDTGLSEIVAVYIRRASVITTGLVNATILVPFDMVDITGCSSYSSYFKSFMNYGSTLSKGDYATIDGGTVSFVGTGTGVAFNSNASHTWYAIGYE